MKKKHNNIAFIFARGGSKGLPGKNIRSFNGKPLIAYAIQHAKSVDRIRRLIVSTDCEKIAEEAIAYGAEVPFLRPKELATDESPEWLSWRHALEFVRKDEGDYPETIVSVPATAPLRLSVDIENCLDAYFLGDTDIALTVTDAHRNPYFNMVKVKNDGYAELVSKPVDKVYRRQDAAEVFDMTTVAYVANAQFVLTHEGIFSGRVRPVFVPIERSIDIDTLLDFEIAEFLSKRNHAL